MIELYDERSGKPLFRTVGAALIFAFNFKGKLRPMAMIREEDKKGKSGNALGGLDGAAQTAFIRNMVADLERPAEAALICRYAIGEGICPHCGNGKIVVAIVKQATIDLIPYVRRAALLGTSARDFATGLYVLRYFVPEKKRHPIEELAERLEVDRKTVRKHLSLAFRALYTLEDSAMDRIERVFRASGIVD